MKPAPDRAAALVTTLGSDNGLQRQRAYQELLEMGSAAVPALVQGARHADWQVRAGCVALMDHLADGRCLIALAKAVRDHSSHVRRHAAHALACQRCKPEPLALDVLGLLLKLAIEDPSIRVRRVAAASLLLQSPSTRAVGALRAMLRSESDEKLVRRVRLALRHHADRGRPCGAQRGVEKSGRTVVAAV